MPPINSDLENIFRDPTIKQTLMPQKLSSFLLHLNILSLTIHLYFDLKDLQCANPITRLHLPVNLPLRWAPFTSPLTSRAARKVGYLLQARCFFTPTHRPLYRAQRALHLDSAVTRSERSGSDRGHPAGRLPFSNIQSAFSSPSSIIDIIITLVPVHWSLFFYLPYI